MACRIKPNSWNMPFQLFSHLRSKRRIGKLNSHHDARYFYSNFKTIMIVQLKLDLTSILPAVAGLDVLVQCMSTALRLLSNQTFCWNSTLLKSPDVLPDDYQRCLYRSFASFRPFLSSPTAECRRYRRTSNHTCLIGFDFNTRRLVRVRKVVWMRSKNRFPFTTKSRFMLEEVSLSFQ